MIDLEYPFNVIAIYCQMFIIMCLTTELNINSFLTIKSINYDCYLQKKEQILIIRFNPLMLGHDKILSSA